MISSKPEDFKERPGAGERLQAWPSTELAEQFLQEREGQESGQGFSRLVLFCSRARSHDAPPMRQGHFRHPARQLRELSGWQYGKRKTPVLCADRFACFLLGAMPARSPGHIPLSHGPWAAGRAVTASWRSTSSPGACRHMGEIPQHLATGSCSKQQNPPCPRKGTEVPSRPPMPRGRAF